MGRLASVYARGLLARKYLIMQGILVPLIHRLRKNTTMHVEPKPETYFRSISDRGLFVQGVLHGLLERHRAARLPRPLEPRCGQRGTRQPDGAFVIGEGVRLERVEVEPWTGGVEDEAAKKEAGLS